MKVNIRLQGPGRACSLTLDNLVQAARPRKSLPAVEEYQEEKVDHQGSTTEMQPL